jgi:hypothetical protein
MLFQAAAERTSRLVFIAAVLRIPILRAIWTPEYSRPESTEPVIWLNGHIAFTFREIDFHISRALIANHAPATGSNGNCI